VLVLCDPRLTTKGYGKLFLASLPPMPRTRELADVRAFFDHAKAVVARRSPLAGDAFTD
jgi:ATP-dependent DNA helicase DinG